MRFAKVPNFVGSFVLLGLEDVAGSTFLYVLCIGMSVRPLFRATQSAVVTFTGRKL